ncbi:ubiquitin-like protein ISG15 [Anolis carolinensis]|uniref:ubiquitin-like protein ISG15 n=1 Tax=Anolis carolinensis TaxID=28377 RepID=UPI002F2B6696
MAMRLHFKMLTGEVHTLTVSPNHTMWEVKVLLERKMGCRRYHQKLAAEAGSGIDLRDASSVASCGLHSGDTLALLVKVEEPIPIFLRNDRGHLRAYQVMPSEAVADFKARVQQQEHVQAGQYWLLYEGKPLENGSLADYGIAPEGTIYLNLRVRGG